MPLYLLGGYSKKMEIHIKDTSILQAEDTLREGPYKVGSEEPGRHLQLSNYPPLSHKNLLNADLHCALAPCSSARLAHLYHPRGS